MEGDVMAECEFINKLDHDGWNCRNCREEYRARKMAAFEKLRRLDSHSSHCDDAACLGCECDPECDDYDGEVGRDYCVGMVDGRIEEREQILKILLEEGFYESLAFLVSEFSDTGLLYEFSDKDAVVDKLHCEPHGWWLEDGELCPVCEGMLIERERIIKLLDNYTMYRFEKQWIVDMIESNE